MQLTRLGQQSPSFMAPPQQDSAQLPVPVTVSSLPALPDNFPVPIEEDQAKHIVSEANAVDIDKLQLSEISLIGEDLDKNLHRIMDSFLARIEKQDMPKVFKLVEKLKQDVENEDLNALADRILNAQPSMGEKIVGFFSKKKLAEATSNAWEEVRLAATGSSKKLSTVIGGMEKELEGEKQRMVKELQEMEKSIGTYREKFVEYAYLCAFAYTLLGRAKTYLAEVESREKVDPIYLTELRDKVQALESRALAIEGMMTRLPSDQLVVRQLQTAGIQTLQETTTTASSRFYSIKKALLDIHSALIIQNLQRMGDQGKALDENLAGVSAKLNKEVITKASTAAGENRLAQANQLKKVVTDTQALHKIVEDGRVKNKQAFDESRKIFSQARQDLAALGTVIRPDKQLSY